MKEEVAEFMHAKKRVISAVVLTLMLQWARVRFHGIG